MAKERRKYSRASAEFDTTGAYRYSLRREWDSDGHTVTFVMLNPSTADATKDDPTIRRCAGFARAWGYGSLEVVNLFAYRTSEPHVLRQATDPIGPANDRFLLDAANRAQTVVVAWGVHGALRDRGEEVLGLLAGRRDIHCLGWTQAGQPRHPLYLRRETMPVVFDGFMGLRESGNGSTMAIRPYNELGRIQGRPSLSVEFARAQAPTLRQAS